MLPPFTTIAVLNLDERPDRLTEVSGEMERLGWQWERFAAIKRTPGWMGYNESIYALMHTCREAENLLLIEDDALFSDDVAHLADAVAQLPEDWQALWLGANLVSKHRQKVGEHLYRLENAWTTHAVLLRKALREYCLTHWTPDMVVFDEWLRREIQPKGHCYVVAPMIAIQRPSYSDIEGKYTDYTQVWENASRRLQ